MRALVTGGLGTIGSCLTASLLKRGNQVTVIDNEEIGVVANLELYLKQEEIKKIKFVKEDILNNESLDYTISNSDVVYHLAATLGTINVVDQPLRMLNVNSHATHKIIDKCGLGDKPLIIMSTSMVYGQNPKAKVNEKDELFVGGNTDVGLWWYAISKLSDEAYANATMLENEQAKIMIIRPFNVIAPVQRPEVGFVIPRFFKSCYENSEIQVYGNGKQRRTFTWAQDFLDCLIKLVENNIWRRTFNIGGTEEISILDLAKEIKKISKSSSEITLVNPSKIYRNQFLEIQRRVPDVSKLMQAINVVPKTSLEEMLKKFDEHYSKKL